MRGSVPASTLTALACFGQPKPAIPASQGPAKACVIDRLDAFARELADPTTTPYERILALKYLMHFAGDPHQSLHASDHEDRGGNCVLVSLGGNSRPSAPQTDNSSQ